jgi:hypothetical protein
MLSMGMSHVGANVLYMLYQMIWAWSASLWSDEVQGTCRYAETWAGFIAMEVAEQNVQEARTLYKRAYSRRFEDNGQVFGIWRVLLQHGSYT